MTVMAQEEWEKVWNLWLAGLNPWELHWLTPRELELHDQFVSGETTFADIEKMIDQAQAPKRVPDHS